MKKLKCWDFDSLKEAVEHFLVSVPKTRNSDKLLTIHIRKKILWSDTMDIYDVMWLPSQDSIKRIRANFNKKWLYKATEKVTLERREREKKRQTDLWYRVL